jgi:ribonucleoside-diphosphate reductase alpha chain
VFSFELLAYRELVNPRAMPGSTNAAEKLPDYFSTADDITPTRARGHPGRRAEVGRLLDLQDGQRADRLQVRLLQGHLSLRHEKGLKGCTTFRFNPEAFQGVLVKEEDLKNTTYVFTLEDGTEVWCKGDEEIEYDGEKHSAANLYDALKEGYYGKF